MKPTFLMLAAFFLLGADCSVRAAETDCLVRDPSTVVKKNGTYWIYGTGKNVQQFSSADRLHWTYRGPVFSVTPAWVAVDVPANHSGGSWAPDIRFFGGTYHLYYCYSTLGSPRSGIGVATNPTLDPGGWTDQGLVVRSPGPDGFNALDPCIFLDTAGNPWLSFGSYFSGIKLMALNAATGKRPSEDSPIYTIAEHPQDPINSVEASYVYCHDGWYYLFVNWNGGGGPRSTYNIRVGRAKVVTGPYLDQDGRDMAHGGGTLFLGSTADDGSGRPFSPEVGPGHAAIFSDGKQDYFTCHYEWAKDRGGSTTVNISALVWDTGGWPRIPGEELPR